MEGFSMRKLQNPYLDLPSKEHRGHIRRFRGLTDLSDEDDVRSRHYVAWKRWNFALMSAAAAKNNTGERPKAKNNTGKRPNMTSKQLRAALKKLGLKQVELAELFGIAESTVGRYAKDGVTNVPTAILLTLLVQRKITVDDVENTRQSPFPFSWKAKRDLERRLGATPVTIVRSR
jgi:transcriptional regulator with XRE-family HTH domain